MLAVCGEVARQDRQEGATLSRAQGSLTSVPGTRRPQESQSLLGVWDSHRNLTAATLVLLLWMMGLLGKLGTCCQSSS